MSDHDRATQLPEPTPDLIAIDARVCVTRDGDPLPPGSVALVLRFATAGVHPLAVAVETHRIHGVLTPVERALREVFWPGTPEVNKHFDRWGAGAFRPDCPSWITAGMVEHHGTSGDSPVAVLAGLDVDTLADGWRITLHTSTGLPIAYRAPLTLVEELWDLLYERWQDLDPESGLFV